MLQQCSPSRVFLIETGATINTSLGRLMVSPHGGDDMLAQVWSWSKYLSTNFTYKISFVNHLYLLNGELHNVPIYVPHSKSSTTTSKSSFILFANRKQNFCINALLQLSKCEFRGGSSGWLWEHQGPLTSLSLNSQLNPCWWPDILVTIPELFTIIQTLYV